MKMFIILIVYSFIFLTNGCKNNSTDPSQNGILYPLKVGNYWKYKTYQLDTVSHSSISQTTVSIEKDSMINNQIWFKAIIQNDSFMPYFSLYSNQSNGFYQYVSIHESNLFYKYPCTINEIYKHNESSVDTIQVTSLQTIIETQAGKFNCIIYRFKYSTFTGEKVYEDIFVAKDVGKIREEYFQYNNKNQIVKLMKVDLVEYKLN